MALRLVRNLLRGLASNDHVVDILHHFLRQSLSEPRHHARIKRRRLPVLRQSDEVLQIRVHRDVLYRHLVGKPIPILDELRPQRHPQTARRLPGARRKLLRVFLLEHPPGYDSRQLYPLVLWVKRYASEHCRIVKYTDLVQLSLVHFALQMHGFFPVSGHFVE